jgi:glycosyltransferase involved in cell wall biosynthesis
VSGDAALLFDPHDEDDICRSMEKILVNDDIRRELVQKGLKRSALFSWSSAARTTLDVINQVYKENS